MFSVACRLTQAPAPNNVKCSPWLSNGSFLVHDAGRSAVKPTQTGGANHPELAFRPPTNSGIMDDMTTSEEVIENDYREGNRLGHCRATICGNVSVALGEITQTDDGVGNEQGVAVSRLLGLGSRRGSRLPRSEALRLLTPYAVVVPTPQKSKLGLGFSVQGTLKLTPSRRSPSAKSYGSS